MKFRIVFELVVFLSVTAAALWLKIPLAQQWVVFIVLGMTVVFDVIRKQDYALILPDIHKPSKEANMKPVYIFAVMLILGLWVTAIVNGSVHVGKAVHYFTTYIASAGLQQYTLLAFCYRRFAALFGEPLASGLSSFLFAAFHFPNPVLLVATFLLAVVTTAIYRKSRNIYIPMLVHWPLGVSVGMCLYNWNCEMLVGYVGWELRHKFWTSILFA